MADFKIGKVEYFINGDDSVTAAKFDYSRYTDGGIVLESGVVIPEMVEHEQKKYKVTSIRKLKGCLGVTIPSSVTSVGELWYCSGITIPSSVTNLGEINMYECSNMKMEFYKGITSLGHVSGLNGVLLPETLTSIEKLDNCRNIIIPPSVISIGEINNCNNITIPSSVTNLGGMYKCSNMKLDFPRGITSLGKISGLTSITLPDTIASIERLGECNNIIIPLSVTSIGYLSSCSNITIPSSVVSIKGVNNCNAVVIPSTITSINSLLSYEGVLMLTIPSSVLTISEIDGEKGTMVLRMESKTPPVVGKVVNISKGDQLIVPQGAIDAYKNDPMWGKFKTIREDPTLGKGTTPAPQQTPTINNAATEKEIAELKQQLAKKEEVIANLKKQLAKKDEEIAELKRQSESKKTCAEPKPQPAPAQPKPVQPSEPTSATVAVPKANGVFKLADYKSKGKLCHTIVKTYVEQHPDVTLAQLKQAFNVPKCDCIVGALEVAMTMTDSSGKFGGNHYVKEADQIKTKEGIVVVWNYWPERYYPDFIANARKAGFTIE